MEDLAIVKELNERLHHIVAALPKAERELIQAIYFEDMPASDYARINIHNCESASPPANNAGAILRAGLTEVPVIGMQQI